MIELNEKTQQDFLNREWVHKLLDAGVDMSDARYFICSLTIGSPVKGENIQVALKEELPWTEDMPGHLPALQYNWACPTYTVSELLYKLHEWIYPTIADKEYSGGLKMIKDAPFYICWYDLGRNEKRQTVDGEETVRVKGPENYIYAEFEYPIESLASLLIQCHKKDIGIKTKDTGDISDK